MLLEFDDVMADADWEPIADLPVTRVSIRLIDRDGGTRMVDALSVRVARRPGAGG